MSKKSVDDYIKEGIYGTKELKPEEKNMFLGTFRERVELALTTGQVIRPEVYPEVERAMKGNLPVELLLNGEISYPHLSKYIKLTNQHGVPFSIVQNEAVHTPIGLVLAHKTAVDKESIFIQDAVFQQEMK